MEVLAESVLAGLGLAGGGFGWRLAAGGVFGVGWRGFWLEWFGWKSEGFFQNPSRPIGWD